MLPSGAPPVVSVVSVAQRAKLDLLAGLMAVAAALACLGACLMFYSVQGLEVHLSLWRFDRWVVGALYGGALVVFAGSFRLRTPWFAGVLAALAVTLIPGLFPAARLLGFVLLCVVFGWVDVQVRSRRM